MQSSELQFMPYRSKAPQIPVGSTKESRLYTNIYDVTLEESLSLEQYVFDCEPIIQDIEISLLRKLILSQKRQL
jgi:hypothetical protein